MHMIISAIVHGVIYDVIWRLMAHLTLAGSLSIGVIVILAAAFLFLMFSIF